MHDASLEHYAREAAKTWLASAFRWDIFASLTFRYDDVADRTAAEAFGLFARRLACERLNRHVRVAWFADYQKRGVVHFHTVLGPLEGDQRRITVADLFRLWIWGDAVIEPYNGASAITYGLNGHRHWDVNVACPRPTPCRRPKGCVHAPGPWPSPGELIL